jgi:hypothetical protein
MCTPSLLLFIIIILFTIILLFIVPCNRQVKNLAELLRRMKSSIDAVACNLFYDEIPSGYVVECLQFMPVCQCALDSVPGPLLLELYYFVFHPVLDLG